MERLPGLGRQAEWRLVEVGLIRCGVVKALVRAAAIVEIEISADRSAGLADVVVGPQVYLLVFDAAPQPLDEHVARPQSSSASRFTAGAFGFLLFLQWGERPEQ